MYEEASNSNSKSIPVCTPNPSNIYSTSSVATFPPAPGAYGQPPSPETAESMTVTPWVSIDT